MRGILGLVVLLVPSAADTAAGQVLPPPSATYVFTTNVEDARAAWINPAGLAVIPEASIYAEVASDRTSVGGVESGWGVRQYTFGLSSRGVGVSYQRDRFLTGVSTGRWRVAAGFPLGRRVAVGTGFTFYAPGRGTDIGIRLAPLPALDIGLVLRDIGRPTVNGEDRPLSGAGGLNWTLGGGRFALAAEAIATERRPLPGYDRTYRAGAVLLIPARMPLSLLTSVELDAGLALARWNFGIALGAQSQLIAVGSELPNAGGDRRFGSLNVAAIARGRTTR